MEDFSKNNEDTFVSKINEHKKITLELKKERDEVVKEIDELILNKQNTTSDVKKNKKIITKVNTSILDESNDDSDTSDDDDDDDDDDNSDDDKVTSKTKPIKKGKVVNKFTVNSSNKQKIINSDDSDDSE